MSKKFKLQITMLSDWHIGTGAGIPGSVDKKVARDRDDFPFIPAKTINGIWRDALETITRGLDGGQENNWSKFADAIFGAQPNLLNQEQLAARLNKNERTTTDSLLTIQPASFPAALRTRILSFSPADKTRYFSALTFIKPGVAIDRDSGSAKPDFLRLEEMGRSGSVLEAEGEFASENETAWAVLVVSAHFISQIGGKRRRGAGRCKWKLFEEKEKNTWQETDLNKSIEHLRSLENKPLTLPQPKEKAATNTLSFTTVSAASEWQSIPYTLTLETPVSIVTATLGNVSESLDFIPGTYLLTPFIKAVPVAQRGEFFQAIAAGDIQILPATIQINGKRGLPVPKSLSALKVGGSFTAAKTVYNRFRDSKQGDEQLKPYRNGYVSSLENQPQLPSYLTVSKTLTMHNVIADEVQRPTEEVGGVYAREAIAAGTVLRGEIHLSKALSEKFKDALHTAAGKVRLGSSKKDDYGLATLTLCEAEALSCSISTDETKELIVFLQSDLLLRNVNLRQTNLLEDLQTTLSEKLGIPLKLKEPTEQEKNFGITYAVLQTRRIESWQTSWGLPRPTLIAIAAGSCAVFTYEGELDQVALQELQTKGIGERRGEGYGQIRFNPWLLTKKAQELAQAEKSHNVIDKPPTNSQPLAWSEEETKFARLLETVVWRAEIQSAAAKIASRLDHRKKIFGFDSTKQEPPQSQIGGLRSVISRLQSKTDRPIVLDWLKHLDETPNRREKWPDDALGKVKKLIKENENEKIWELFDEVKIGDLQVWNTPPLLAQTEQDLKKQLWAEAVRTLFYECAHTHKRATEKNTKGAGTNG